MKKKSGKMKGSGGPESNAAAPVLGATKDGGTLAACRKRRMTGKYYTSALALTLPRDIIYKILLLLPATLLIETARFVCKELNAIITDPLFITAHLLQLSSSLNNACLIVQDQDRHDAKLKRAFYLVPGKTARCRPTVIDLPIRAAVLASCNGLLLLHSATKQRVLLLANLVTKTNFTLPPLTGVYILDRPFATLGFAPCSGQYKVVYVSVASQYKRTQYAKRTNIFRNHLDGCQVVVSVFTLGVDQTWRTIDCKTVTQCIGGKGALLHGPPLSNNAGSIYWLSNAKADYGLVLDLDAEVLHPFGGLRLVDGNNSMDPTQVCCIKVGTAGVGAAYLGENVLEVWELIEPKSKSKTGTWTKLVDVDKYDMHTAVKTLFPTRTVLFYKFLFFSFEKQELWITCRMNDHCNLLCYDWKTGSCRSFVIDKPWPTYAAIPHLYLNSLLSLNKQSLPVT